MSAPGGAAGDAPGPRAADAADTAEQADGAAPTVAGQQTASDAEGSWDAPLRMVGRVLKHLIAVGVVALVVLASDTPARTALYIASAAWVGAVIVRLMAGSKYIQFVIVGTYFAALPVLRLLMDDVPLGVFLIGYLLGLLFGPIDEAKRDERRAR